MKLHFVLLCLLCASRLVQAAGLAVNPENAVWKVYTNRSEVSAITLSADGEMLWVGVNGGLEQRDAQSAQLLKVFTTVDGLPHNSVQALLSAGSGLWVGTREGLAHFGDHGWQVFTSGSSELPHNDITVLLADGGGGVWAGMAMGRLAHFNADGEWRVFNRWVASWSYSNSAITSLLADGSGGLWVGTDIRTGAGSSDGGLAHLRPTGEWGIFSSSYSGLPDNYVNALLSDGAGGLWAGTQNGLAHLSAVGEWTVFNIYNSELPDDRITALLDDDQGGLWAGTRFGGVAHRDVGGAWSVFSTENSDLPGNYISTLAADDAGGLWIGTHDSGFAHRNVDGEWRVFNRRDENLPDNEITALTGGANGDLWIGTDKNGIVRYSADGEWLVFNHENSRLPDDDITALSSAADGSLWIGTESGLVKRDAGGEWTVFTQDNSGLPGNWILSLLTDADGGVWLGFRDDSSERGVAHRSADGNWRRRDDSSLPNYAVTSLAKDVNGVVWAGSVSGLAYLDAFDNWTTLNSKNSELPADRVYSLSADPAGGVWVGTDRGLAQVSAAGDWTVYTPDNAEFPTVNIDTLLPDGAGGVWIGASFGSGLIHLSVTGEWAVFNTANSPLPDDYIHPLSISALAGDGNGGVWAGSRYGGLAHLSFGRKPNLLKLEQIAGSAEHTESILRDRRAAIIIHPRGRETGFNQAAAVDFMAAYAYHSLNARGYDNDEIYFLSHRPDLDFNSDTQADFNVIDAPVTLAELRAGAQVRDLSLDDVRNAFIWATAKGRLDQPLLLVFVDHGIPDGLLLEPTGQEILDTATFKNLLDDYQTATGSEAVVILEACHSGSLLNGLSAENRLIVTSTGEGLAYYDDLGRTSFLKLYFDQLRMGESYWLAWQAVTQILHSLRSPLSSQTPRLNDFTDTGVMARELCLNGCFGGMPGVLTLTVETSSIAATVEPGETVELDVRTRIAGSSVRSVWASVITPEVASQRTAHGYSRLPTPVAYLRKTADDRWQGNFSEFSAQGEYAITVKARDNTGFVTDAEPVTLRVEQGQAITHAHFDFASEILHLPAVTVPNALGGTDIFQADLLLRSSDPVVLEFISAAPAGETASVSFANFTRGTIHIPVLNIPNASGGMDEYSINLQLVPDSSPIRFTLGTM